MEIRALLSIAEIRGAILAALQAPNPQANVTISQARRLQDICRQCQWPLKRIFAVPTLQGPVLAEEISLEELETAGIASDFPMYFFAEFANSSGAHIVALLLRCWDGTPAGFARMWQAIYPYGRSGSDMLLEAPPVREAIQKAIQSI
jgi:hypothetical protein